MLISPPSNPPLQAILSDAMPVAGRQAGLAQAGGTSVPDKAAAVSAPDISDAVEGDRVSLTAVTGAGLTIPELAPVYAEIWKNGTKVAEIDTHGGVTPTSGLVASSPGTVGASGALLAARRAAEIVRSIGGEHRVGGQTMDNQTLEMRAKLEMFYGT